MVKICHMTSAHGPEDVRIFHKECVSLAKAGYEVYLVERGGSYEKNGVHIVGVGQPGGGRLSRMTGFARRVYQAALMLDADVYHLHDPELLPYGLKLKKKGKKVVFDSHEYYRVQIKSKPYVPKFISRCMAGCYAVVEDYLLRRIDGIIFPCLINGENPFAGKCRHFALINNVPMLEELYHSYDETVPKHERSVIYIGGLTYARGIVHIIKASAKAQCTVYLAGAYSPPSFRSEAEALPEFSNVEYLGILDRPQVLEALQKCEIGMATILNVGQYNQSDNLATKVYEYMSLGLPVILSRTPYNEKMIKTYGFGLCADPENVDEIASAVRCLLDNPETAKQMGENGRRAVKEAFNWSIEEKKLFALYEDILKE